MKSYLVAIPVCLGLALVAAPAARAGSANVMADSCAGCHGTGGQSLGAMPAFNTKSADELKKMLRDYRSGAREATIMDRITKGYSEAQLDAIVDYYKK
ncbi:sulfide dehydrogenase [Paramagnetospirillum kuznetsovii]|uniref:Sulfide dehydrogenase n=1 Tax=Paramagnetospirillum kuznetsovii TaxID=2053833 RepID=A0A364NU28_9PROT|nr:c-type cytochrome [Paramagnetospirillum kuznetsovii]RAU20581.1 sulfide dehydrogenase [Paramagnetospirillum kuznetsovii]